MKLIDQLKDPFEHTFPISLTIGNFDGVHLGHQELLYKLVDHAGKNRGKACVITFSNHPKQVFDPHFHPKLITTAAHKVTLLKEAGIDGLIRIPFTKAFSEQTADEFLEKLRSLFPLSMLMLGYDARLGKNREGDKETVLNFAKEHSLSVEYIEEKQVEGLPISSTRIRQAIQAGDFQTVEKLLGRAYSLYGQVHSENSRHTLFLPDLALPPKGIYPVTALQDGMKASVQLHLFGQEAVFYSDQLSKNALTTLLFTH